MSVADDNRSTTRARTADEMAAVRAMLNPFRLAGYQLFPLRMGTKIPRDIGWQRRRYPIAQLRCWLEEGGNLGIALKDDDLVVDVDLRNFANGLDSLALLELDLGIDLGTAPTVISGRGDGGRHIYFKKPRDLRLAGKLKGYPGVDFKSKGQMVAPGSRHPETGGVYRPDPDARAIGEVDMAPPALLDALRRPDQAAARVFGGGELTVEQLEMLLGALDPRAYGRGRYDPWIRFAAACHDATNGEGLEVWQDWAAGDDDYGAEAVERNDATWASFTAGRPGGATYLTILAAVVRAGRPDLVAQIDPLLDFSAVTPVADTPIIHVLDQEDEHVEI